MIKVWMLFTAVISLSVSASEFTHIKLNPQFEEYLTRPSLKSLSLKSALSAKGVSQPDSLDEKLRSSILGGAVRAKGDWTGPIPVDGEESLLYDEIRRHLESAHQGIGGSEVAQINRFNQQFNLGNQNFSGFSWQRPFGVIQIYVDRQVTPNILGEDWLIQDTFTFSVEATTFLEKLNENGLSSMSAVEIGFFAGMTFQRVYTYYHYAKSYTEGLSADFSKLFLPFVRFNKMGIERMGHEEVIKREDMWTIRAGGMITSPPVYNMSLSGGVLAEHAFTQKTTVQTVDSSNDKQEKYRIGVYSQRKTDIGATLELQLDFFKLIKFTLLRYDLNYEYASGKEFTLGLSKEQWKRVGEDETKDSELKKILRGMGTVQELESYVVRLDESTSSALQQRGSILIFGKLQKSKTEQVRVIKDEVVNLFFKSYSQSVKVVQNIFSRIFSAIIYKLLKFPVGATNAAMYNRQMNIEYAATHPQAADPNVSRVESTEKFSFSLFQSYEAARTDRWIDQLIKNDVIWFVDVFTTLPKDYKTIIRSEQLKGPLRVESNLRIEKAGLDYLLNSPNDDVFGTLAQSCKSKRAQEWINEARRAKLLVASLLGAESCVQRMGKKFLAFKNDYLQSALQPSLKKFKDFLADYYKESQSIEALVSLFGIDNTFITGRLQAKHSSGAPFVLPFSSGQFRGLGVIDNFKRSTGSRNPASILSE